MIAFSRIAVAAAVAGSLTAVSAQSISIDTVISRVKGTLSQIQTYQADANVAYTSG